MHLTTDLTYVKALHAERTNPSPQPNRPRRTTTANGSTRARLMGGAMLNMARRFRTVPTPSRALWKGRASST